LCCDYISCLFFIKKKTGQHRQPRSLSNVWSDFTIAAYRNTEMSTTNATIGIVLSFGLCFPLFRMPLFFLYENLPKML